MKVFNSKADLQFQCTAGRAGCTAVFSSLTESSQLRSGQGAVYGPCDAVPKDEPCVQCRVGGGGGARS